MRRVLTLAFVVTCGTWAFAQTGGTQRSGSAGAAAIKAVADSYVKASLAGDVKAIVALYTDDAMEMPPNQPMIKGKAGLQQYYEKMMAGAKLTSFTLDHIESQQAGDIGYDVGTYRQSMTPAGGQAMSESGKYCVLLKRVGGTWKVAYAIYNSDVPPQPMK
jgi:uncharacterized protein (TIGR02246 family)